VTLVTIIDFFTALHC